MKLLERALVKDLANIPRADTQWDTTITAMIERASFEVEDFTRRKFEELARVDYFKSYEQNFYEPDPQYIFLPAFPVDIGETFTIVWAAYDNHDTNGSILDAAQNDYILNDVTGVATIRGASGLVDNIPVSVRGLPIFTYDPRGFKVTYTGGYALSVGVNTDPLDDFGVVQVPDSLKIILAKKIADDWKEAKMLLPWTKEQRQSLKPWKLRDLI